MHVADETEILLVTARLTYRAPPLLDRFEDLALHAGRPDGGSLREPSDQLIEELLGADLQVEWIAAVLDADVEQVQS